MINISKPKNLVFEAMAIKGVIIINVESTDGTNFTGISMDESDIKIKYNRATEEEGEAGEYVIKTDLHTDRVRYTVPILAGDKATLLLFYNYPRPILVKEENM